MARKSKLPTFENRVRFNWGYHDAALVVEQNWQSSNYGFGPTLKITCPADVLSQHFDPTYAQGWTRGYRDASNGIATDTSEPAWIEAKRVGDVRE